MPAMNNAAMQAVITGGGSVSYRGAIITLIASLPSDAQIAIDAAADAAAASKAVTSTAPAGWAVNNAPAAATQATITKAAGTRVQKHHATGIYASVACGATAQTPIGVVLRDGLTGAGAVLWTGELAAIVDGVGEIDEAGMDIPGSAATAMTLEFLVAGVAASIQTVTLTGYTL